jgi:RNA polymerase sigma factor (sigma-70 family)
VETQTDSSLMMLVQAGEPAHLALLFERHHISLFRYLLYLSRNQALSEDLVQEAFLRVLKYAPSYDASLAFPVWLFGIARNLYFDSLNRNRAELPNTDFTEIRSTAPMPEELLTRKQDMMFLEKALQRLPEDKREVLILSRFHNLRYEDIARITRCEIGTVKVRVYRALRELRETFCELRGEKLNRGKLL